MSAHPHTDELRKRVSMGEAAFDEVLAFAEDMEFHLAMTQAALRDAYNKLNSEGQK